MTEITKYVEVKITVNNAAIVQILVDVFCGMSKDDSDKVLWYALRCLVGISDVEAVAQANTMARSKGLTTITTKQFREWLPGTLSAAFDKMMKVVDLE